MYKRKTKRFIANQMKGGSSLQARGLQNRLFRPETAIKDMAQRQAESFYGINLATRGPAGPGDIANPKAARGQYISKSWQKFLRG